MSNQALAATEEKAQPVTPHPFLIVAGIILLSFTMRSPLTSVGPLVGDIRSELGLSNGISGMLTTVPLLAFGLFSPIVPSIGQRFGVERTLLFGLLVLLIGIPLRSTGFIFSLFAGTALIGAAIAVFNVLLPSLVKQRFPSKAGLMTSVYTTSMSTMAALASGVSIPLAHGAQLGWKGSLSFWTVIAVVAFLCWLPQVRAKDVSFSAKQTPSPPRKVWSSTLAWHVTLFMGLQSFLFYSTISWLPAILAHHGMEPGTAGWLLSLVQVVSLPASFLTPVLAGRIKDQRLMAVIVSILSLCGFAGLLVDGNLFILFTSLILLGIAQGALISLALTMIVIRSSSVQDAAKLSGMAQSVGYLLSAIGPMFIGFLFDLTHSWTYPLWTLVFVSFLLLFFGIGAGRNKTV
jgi:CP family cyanate transporter-like MFS transporter